MNEDRNATPQPPLPGGKSQYDAAPAVILARIRRLISAYRDKNVADHVKYHGGWRQLVENIHVHYSELARKAALQDREKQGQNRRGFT